MMAILIYLGIVGLALLLLAAICAWRVKRALAGLGEPVGELEDLDHRDHMEVRL